MKKLFFILAMILPFMANAMKIEKDEIDEFTGKRTVITSWEGICKNQAHLRFRNQNGKNFLDFRYTTKHAMVIGKGDKLMFKSTSDDIVDFESIEISDGHYSSTTVMHTLISSWENSVTYVGNIAWFADNTAKLFRLYATDGYRDEKISESDGKKLMKLYELFNSTINGKGGKSVFANYNLTFVKRGVNKKEWDIVKEEYKQDMSTDEINTLVNEWKSQSNDKILYDVRIKKDK